MEREVVDKELVLLRLTFNSHRGGVPPDWVKRPPFCPSQFVVQIERQTSRQRLRHLSLIDFFLLVLNILSQRHVGSDSCDSCGDMTLIDFSLRTVRAPHYKASHMLFC
jgi:hypothetical protein